MTARLGNVIYWACSGLAVLLLVLGLMIPLFDIGAGISPFLGFGFFALLAWLVGRALHYVLGGDATA